jgi:hypothetical protein
MLLGVGIGVLAGWQARSWRSAALQPPMADAIQAYRMFSHNQAGQFDFVSQRYSDLQAWMDAHFVSAPNPIWRRWAFTRWACDSSRPQTGRLPWCSI